MSIAEIERFAADVNSNVTLRAELEACAKASRAAPIDGVAALATAKGYGFTAGELKEQVTATAKAAGKKVTDAELDGISGGFAPGPSGEMQMSGWDMFTMMLVGPFTGMFGSPPGTAS